jgi:hypothetical protein
VDDFLNNLLCDSDKNFSLNSAFNCRMFRNKPSVIEIGTLLDDFIKKAPLLSVISLMVFKCFDVLLLKNSNLKFLLASYLVRKSFQSPSSETPEGTFFCFENAYRKPPVIPNSHTESRF